MQIIKPDPVLIENAKTALRILETCAKAAATALNHSSFPAVLVPEGDGAKVRPLEPGEIVEVAEPAKEPDIQGRPLKAGEVVEVPPPCADHPPCLSYAGGEACIKGKGHPGDHAGNKFVWN